MVEGKYKTEGKIMGTVMENICDFHVDGDVLTGTMTVMGTVAEISDGKVDDDEFSGKFAVTTPFGDLKVECEGEVDGDDIEFYIFNKLVKSKFVGERMEDE